MSTKPKVRKMIKEGIEVNKSELEKFIASLPDMVEEVKETRRVKGADLIKQLLSEGKKAEAAQHKPNLTYTRVTERLRQINHRENVMAIFKKSGAKGLVAYRNKVIKQAHYIKGKYPEIFPGTPEYQKKHGLFSNFMRWVGISSILFMVNSCTPTTASPANEPKLIIVKEETILKIYKEGLRIGRLAAYSNRSKKQLEEIWRRDSAMIHNTLNQQ